MSLHLSTTDISNPLMEEENICAIAHVLRHMQFQNNTKFTFYNYFLLVGKLKCFLNIWDVTAKEYLQRATHAN